MDRRVALRRTIDAARRQGGVITRNRALEVGATPRLLMEWTRSGVLVRRHPGVYVLTGVPDDHRLAIRAALASLDVPGAAASHWSAAWLQGLVDRPPPEVELTGCTAHRRIAGVRVHRTREPLEHRPFQGIACTLPPRTLLDVAATANSVLLADAVDRALASRIVRARDLLRELDKGRHRGSEQLRRCMDEHGLAGAPHPSVLESRMARVVTRFGLPLPRVEVIAGEDGEYRIDYTNPARRLAVELYGYTWHHSPRQMASDHARQRRLTVEGWTVLVFTWQDVTNQPERVAAEIRGALARAAAG